MLQERTHLIGSTVHHELILDSNLYCIIQVDSHQSKVPWVIMRMAQSIEGCSGKKPQDKIIKSSPLKSINFELLPLVNRIVLEEMLQSEKNAKRVARLEKYIKALYIMQTDP